MILHNKEKLVENENKELIIVIRKDGKFEIDFQTKKGKLSERERNIQQDIINRFKENENNGMFSLGFLEAGEGLSESLNYLRFLIGSFTKKLSMDPDIEVYRDKAVVGIEEKEIKELLDSSPYLTGSEHLTTKWIEEFWKNLNNSFSDMIKDYKGSVAEFFSSFNSNINLVGHVFFHLVESKKDDYPFAFLATYSVRDEEGGTSKHLPLKNALIEYGKDNEKILMLLSTVNKAAERSEFIKELINTGEIFHPLSLSSGEAYTFLKEIYLYEESGILCRIPKWWKNKSESLKMSISVGNGTPSRVNMEALIDFDANIFLGEEKITEDEIRKLMSEAEGLSFIKGKWVEVNHEKLNELLKAYEKAEMFIESKDINIIEAMKFQLNPKKVLNNDKEDYQLEVTNGQWLNSVIDRLSNPEKIESITCGNDFNANLRDYQQRGISWLSFMKNLGLGACLADDMGLGKTIQVIALLNSIRSNKEEKTLLVVPASLIGNWMSEIEKFAPSLRYVIIHPSENKNIGEAWEALVENNDLVITTYAMVSKYEWIKDITWSSVILDEAQAIKNPGTKQTKTIKQLKAKYRIAMTGTPIENRLSDLWSLFDFLNKGLLGSSKEFSDFIKGINEKQKGYASLKKVISPFILRRLKTDKTVISDLPEKIEMKTYSTLTKKQAMLYTKLVNDLKKKLESSEEGIERKGLVISSLMKFKQICNHPSQYLGQEGYAPNESGKYERLREICETIYEKRERVIIFTQFKEITKPLSEFLETIFEHEGLVLHGGTSVKNRKDIVDKFQGDEYVPFMVLSIKAGGVGLNLTAASHVIHFDRWWNPAVENQATDRAFRIGQKKNVIVHKFITKGTIEEKIDMMIEDKIKLSNEIVPDIQESFITEMSNADIMDLFKLNI